MRQIAPTTLKFHERLTGRTAIYADKGVQNYDVRASHRPVRQMAFLGFRSRSLRTINQYAKGVSALSFGLSRIRALIGLNYIETRRLGGDYPTHRASHENTDTTMNCVIPKTSCYYIASNGNYPVDMEYVSKFRFFVTFAKV